MMRRAEAAEVETILDWAAEEGWNPGLDDAAAFYAADPDGFFVAEQGGEIVAAISVVNHAPDFAFLGLYLCRPAHRGQGLGFALWRHALDHAGARVVGLDGVADQQANYARSGFVLTGCTTRMQGQMVPGLPDDAIGVFAPADLDALAALDQQANGVTRPRFLAPWLRGTPTRKTVTLSQAGRIVGFATARICRMGCKIGPVIAPDTAGALRLMRAALGAVGATDAIVDIPDSQPGFRNDLAATGFRATFETARMYRGAPPRADKTLFGVATLELG